MSEDALVRSLTRVGVRDALAAALVAFAREAPDESLVRINPLAFSEERGFDPNEVIGGFLRAGQVGLFDLTWSVHCPSCGGKLDTVASAKSLKRGDYACTMCNLTCEAVLDDVVEATFTVNPRVRRVPGHQPDDLPFDAYYRTSHFSTRLPVSLVQRFSGNGWLASATVPCGEHRTLSLTLGAPGQCIVFEPVEHATFPLEIGGDASREVQRWTLAFNGDARRQDPIAVRPGRVELVVENRWSKRILPSAILLTPELHEAFQAKRPFLSGKRLFMHPTFRELYRTDALDIDQQLKIESMTVLFTDLKGSTELYERVGDLVAFDLVRKHFVVLERAVASQGGSVVKTIGDAVMATFPSPELGLAAALAMRDALDELNRGGASQDLSVKIGLHDGPCLAVMLNERLDYFGQTVNIAARVQGLAEPHAILTTRPVLSSDTSARLLESRKLRTTERRANLKGIRDEMALFEIASAG